MKIFIVNGKGCVGKTSFETMVQEIAAAHGEKVEILSTINYVKEVAKIFGWNGEKEPKDRKMLSDLKDILTEWNDLPYKNICKTIKNLKDTSIVFIDCREPAEIKRFVKDFNALTLLVNRKTCNNIIYGNHADDNVNNYDYDCIVDNSRGLTELFNEAQIFYECFIEER